MGHCSIPQLAHKTQYEAPNEDLESSSSKEAGVE